MGIKKQGGQSTVEYLLLISVVIILLTAVIKNRHLQNYIGEGGEFFRRYKQVISYTYRHGRYGNKEDGQDDYILEHDTYKREGDRPKFVIPLGAYPKEP